MNLRLSNNYISHRIRVCEDNKFQHNLKYFEEAYVVLRPGARGHQIPRRTQLLAQNYQIKAHIRL